MKKMLDEVFMFFLLKLTTDIVLLLRNAFANACHVLVDDPQYGHFLKDCIGALDGLICRGMLNHSKEKRQNQLCMS